MPWRARFRAVFSSRAPICCATKTMKPVVKAKESPPSSQVLDATSPIAALSIGPSRPTIDASMYCMNTDESWARIVGQLSVKVKSTASLRESGRFS